MDQQDTTPDSADAEWPELSADLSQAQTTARTITLDTQRASSDGRILEITAQLDQIRTRLSSLEEHLFEATTPGTSSGDDLLLRLSALDTEIAHTTSQFESLASRVATAEENVSTTMMMSLDGFDSRVALVEDARSAQANELNQLTSYLEQAFLRITELAEAIEEERFSNRAVQGERNEWSAQLANDVDTRIVAIQETVSSLTERLDSGASSIDASNSEVQDAIVASLAKLESRVDTSEHRLGHLDEVSTAIQFLASRTEALETQQHDVDPNQATRAEVEELSTRIELGAEQTALSLETAERDRSEIIEHADHAHRRIDAAQDEIRDLRTQLDRPAESEGVEAELEELRSTLSNVVDAQQASVEAHSVNRAQIDSTRSAVDEAQISSSHAHQLASDASDRIGNMAETTELIGQRVDAIEAATDELNGRYDTVRSDAETSLNHARGLDETVDGLTTRLGNAAIAIDAAHNRIDENEAAALSAHTRIDETAHTLTEKLGDTETSTQSAHGRIDAIEESTQSTHSRIDEVASVAQSAHPRIDEVTTVAQSAHARIDESARVVNERIADANRDFDGRLAESIGQVDERLDDTVRSVNQKLDETVEHLNQQLDESTNNQPVVDPAVVDSLRSMTDKNESLETHIGEMDRRFDSLDEGLVGFDQHLSDIDTRVRDVALETTSLAEQSVAISSRLDETVESMDEAASTAAEIAARVDATDGRISATEDRISRAQLRIDEGLAGATATASNALEATSRLDDKLTASIDERSNELREQLLGRIEEARAQLQRALEESNASSSDEQTDLRETVLDRLDAVEVSVERRMSAIEQSPGNEERLESIEARLEETDTTATEAYSYADSLRLLQTDIVQALQEELRTHEDRLEKLDDQVGEVRASTPEHASAERVHMLEAKLVEALQTISQLTQLQRRNTTIEAQLTDTLTATSHGVESTQMSVSILRSDLEAAQERIAQLERLLTTGQHSQIASVDSVVASAQPAAGKSGPAIFELSEEFERPTATEVGPDTGWFTESYARRSQEAQGELSGQLRQPR